MRRLCFAGILAFSVGLIAFAPACRQQALPDTRAADERAIRNADTEWLEAVKAKDIERTLRSYADEASMYPPHAPIVNGKEAIRAFWSQGFLNPGFALDWQATQVQVSRAGDLAYSRGTYDLRENDAKGRPIIERGKYVVVWKKQPDGAWKAVADIWNADQPLLAAPAPPQRRR